MAKTSKPAVAAGTPKEKTLNDYLPGVFNPEMLKKKAVTVLPCEDRNMLLIRYGPRLLQYTRRVANGWSVCVDVWVIKEEKDVPLKDCKRYRILMNGTVDNSVVEFWEAVQCYQLTRENMERDSEVQTTLGTLKEILEDHADYQ